MSLDSVDICDRRVHFRRDEVPSPKVRRVGTAHQFLPFAGTIKPAVSERGRNLIVNPDNNSPSRRRFSLLPSHPSTNNLPNVRTLEECYVNSTHAPTAPHSGGVQCLITPSAAKSNSSRSRQPQVGINRIVTTIEIPRDCKS